jgi:hypothetical protein
MKELTGILFRKFAFSGNGVLQTCFRERWMYLVLISATIIHHFPEELEKRNIKEINGIERKPDRKEDRGRQTKKKNIHKNDFVRARVCETMRLCYATNKICTFHAHT